MGFLPIFIDVTFFAIRMQFVLKNSLHWKNTNFDKNNLVGRNRSSRPMNTNDFSTIVFHNVPKIGLQLNSYLCLYEF